MSAAARNEENKYLVILGSGYSGSGAIYDYLSGVKGFYPALSGHEFRLIHEPGGLNELYEAISSGFHPNRANDAIYRFKRLAHRCSNSRKAMRRGLGYAESILNYQEKIESYLRDILLMSYEGLPWVGLADKGRLRVYTIGLIRKLYAFFGVKKPCGSMYVPIEEKQFLDKTRSLIDELLSTYRQIKLPDDFLLVNQGGSFWRPEESTFLYRSRKILVVTRDPRDIYAEFKLKGFAYPGDNVSNFCCWYASMMARRKKVWDSGLVSEVSFEDFVRGRECEFTNLSEFLSKDLRSSSYDLSKSRKNVGKYKKTLNHLEIGEIESSLAEYIWKGE